MKLKTYFTAFGLLIGVLLTLRSFAAPADETAAPPNLAKKSVTVDLINNGNNIQIKMGQLIVTLPTIPRLEQSDLPEGANLAEAQLQFDAEFQNLSDTQKDLFFANRMTFLRLSAEVFNSIKYGIACVNCVVEHTKGPFGQVKSLVKRTKEYTKTKFWQVWDSFKSKPQISEENSPKQDLDNLEATTKVIETDPVEQALQESLFRLENSTVENGSNYFSSVIEKIDPDVKTDLITKSLTALNKIFYQNAELGYESVGFGVTIGIGGSVSAGAKNPELARSDSTQPQVTQSKESKGWAAGVLADLLLHISYRSDTETYSLNVETLTELINRPLTLIMGTFGIEVRVGVNFTNDNQQAISTGKSVYTGLGPFGKTVKSNYGNRIITWLSTDALGAVFGSDFMGFESQGLIVKVISVEGREINPLLFRLGKASVVGQIYHFLKDIIKTNSPATRCENFVF